MPSKTKSRKPEIFERLYELYEQGQIPGGVVTNTHVIQAITNSETGLGIANPANFIKDVIRSKTANNVWPESLKQKQVSARQRYGKSRVFQFVPYTKGQTVPFPDRFIPSEQTKLYEVQSASMPFAARQLGRAEETWLTQIVVNLRLVEAQLSIFSPQLRDRVRDITHLQMGLKTSPEIDAVFLASFGETPKLKSATDLHMLVSCEAKQLRERILEDQIREQVAKAMEITSKLKNPEIQAVKPMAIKVVEYEFPTGKERAVYIVEFRHIDREEYAHEWANSDTDEERLYAMPLTRESDTIYRIMPRVSGLNA